MKIINKISLVIVLSTLVLTTKSQAVTFQVQVVPSNSRITNVTVSQSFEACREMDSTESTLGTTRLDPHLVTNKDWGAVAYLANSIYGVNTKYDMDNSKSGRVGKEVTVDAYTFFSTTGNGTGVMNWGGIVGTTRICTQTSSLINDVIKLNESEVETEVTSTTYGNIAILYQNRNKRYVERVDKNISTSGMAMVETPWGEGTTWRNERENQKDHPITIRNGLFGYASGKGVWELGIGNDLNYTTGAARSNTTFRPVIWNIE